jgi:radical SAM protein with 4Fe4S-binding SPASM domain
VGGLCENTAVMRPEPRPSDLGPLRRNLGRLQKLVFEPDRLARVRRYLRNRRIAALEAAPDTDPAIPPERAENRELLARELAREAIVLESHPTSMTIDPVTACNLRCPFCPTGGGYTGLKKETLTPDLFERIVANLRTELLDEVNFYNWGEPFLNRNIFEYIRFFADQRTRTEVSTNFSVDDYGPEFLEQIVASGLTTLVVSIDGASQETYGKYRIRGSWSRVVGNMKNLAEVKRAHGVAHPRVAYKMLLHRFNEHEIDQARRVAEECDADFLLNERFWCPDELRDEWIARRVLDGHDEAIPQGFSSDPGETISTYCRQLWDSAIVNANGDVFPCCLVFRAEDEVGNLVRQDIREIRNNPRMLHLRRFVTDSGTSAPDFPNDCEQCPSRWCAVKRRAPSATPT